MSDKKITYLLGAGASYQSYPILNELGDKMIEMAKNGFPQFEYNPNERKKINDVNKRILYDIGHFGHKAKEYGTIDTYAKRLYLNYDTKKELTCLKLAVSTFFTLWQILEQKNVLKAIIRNGKGYRFKKIDTRYISLIATFLEKTQHWPKLNDRVKFITWNYDLQLEMAYKSFFAGNNVDFYNVNENFRFKTTAIKETNGLDVCHLNGYCGFYRDLEFNKEGSFIESINSSNIQEALEDINFVYEECIRKERICVNDYISYAWESTETSKNAIKFAKETLLNSDIVVIIGYSFPPFNRKTDQMLFEQLKGRSTKIYYQDPNASEDLIKTFIEPKNCKITPIKDSMGHFVVPFEY